MTIKWLAEVILLEPQEPGVIAVIISDPKAVKHLFNILGKSNMFPMTPCILWPGPLGRVIQVSTRRLQTGHLYRRWLKSSPASEDNEPPKWASSMDHIAWEDDFGPSQWDSSSSSSLAVQLRPLVMSWTYIIMSCSFKEGNQLLTAQNSPSLPWPGIWPRRSFVVLPMWGF